MMIGSPMNSYMYPSVVTCRILIAANIKHAMQPPSTKRAHPLYQLQLKEWTQPNNGTSVHVPSEAESWSYLFIGSARDCLAVEISIAGPLQTLALSTFVCAC